ncbi:hypothetical protein L596_025340 [Steinernema carpocapsae]|uniref:Chitin-binding type-2 domain-containing protein n=1 Tax=Steinernema carpocapsae TaxID=34508 RepID=A0A4U5M8C4_STECR|nr:hypothetical protein L596_025340 [Steinernema carpocapsae]
MFLLLLVAFAIVASSSSQGSPPSPGCFPYTCVPFTPECPPGFNLIADTATVCAVSPQLYRYEFCAHTYMPSCDWSPCMEWNADYNDEYLEEACDPPIVKSSWFCCPN